MLLISAIRTTVPLGAATEAAQQIVLNLKILQAPVKRDAAINTCFVATSLQRKGITCPYSSTADIER